MDRFEEVPFPVESFSPANDRRCLSAVKARIAQTRQVSANKGLPERVGSTTPRYVNLVSPRSRHLNLLHSRSPSPSLLASPPFPLFRSLNRLQPSQSTPESGSFSQAGVDFNPFSSYRFSARDEHERRGGPEGGCAPWATPLPHSTRHSTASTARLYLATCPPPPLPHTAFSSPFFSQKVFRVARNPR